MAVDKFAGFIYRCDATGCKAEHVQQNANGHYHNSVPPDWLEVRLAMGDRAPKTWLLCTKCAYNVTKGSQDFANYTLPFAEAASPPEPTHAAR